MSPRAAILTLVSENEITRDTDLQLNELTKSLSHRCEKSSHRRPSCVAIRHDFNTLISPQHVHFIFCLCGKNKPSTMKLKQSLSGKKILQNVNLTSVSYNLRYFDWSMQSEDHSHLSVGQDGI